MYSIGNQAQKNIFDTWSPKHSLINDIPVCNTHFLIAMGPSTLP